MADGATTTEVVLIDFQTNLKELQTATDILEHTGVIDKKLADQFKRTNVEIKNQQTAINNTAKAMQSATQKEADSIEDLRSEMQQFVNDFIKGFQEGVIETLKEAGIEFDEFGNVVNKNAERTAKGTTSLKKELRELTQRIAEAKLAGEDTGPAFDAMVRRAGEIRDAMGDAAGEINKFASDTGKLDGLIDVAQGVAGGFAVAQGTVALFGDESEALQETLLKVNAAMAVLQGLQQIGNVLQKESAASVLLNTTAQKLYNIAIGESIGLLKAFRIALALTGVGAIIVGLTILVEWLNKSSEATKQLTKDFQRFNAEIERDLANFENNLDTINRATEERVAQLEALGEAQSRITRASIDGMKEELTGVIELQNAMRDRATEANEILKAMATGERDFNEALYDQAQTTINTFEDLRKRRADIATRIRVQSIENERQIVKERLQSAADGLEAQLAQTIKNSSRELEVNKQLARARAAIELNEAGQNLQKRLLIEKNLQKQLRELDLNFAKVRQQDRIAAIEASIANEQDAREAASIRTSQAEIDLQKRLIQQNARLALLEEGLTANQRLAIIKKSLAEQAKLQRDFNQQTTRESLEDFISRNNAELANIKLSRAEKLQLTEENIIAQAEIEIQANKGVDARIKEIKAKRDADIKAARLQTLQETVAQELEIEAARTGALRRGQERVLSSERSTLQQRIKALNQLAVLDIANINARQDALEKQLRKGLISQEDYLVEYEKLKDEELAVTERTEQAKADMIRAFNRETIEVTVQIAQQIADIFQQIGDQRAERQQNELQLQRQAVDELLQTGAITEREAERRQRKLDAEEKKLRRQQAQREKEFATFKALLAIPQAFLQGLTQGGPVLAAIYAGLAAAQAIVIASRQIPKFGGGKNNDYEGPAEIAETGPEIWQTDSGAYYVKKRAFVYVGKHDRVFNPAQTRAIMQKPQMQLDQISVANSHTNNTIVEIDYDKMGQAISKHLPQTGFNFDEEGFSVYQRGKNSFDKYIGKRRGY